MLTIGVSMVSMKERTLGKAIEELSFGDHKMALVSGPRQCGKTTMAKMLLERRKAGRYWNWDEVELRQAWARNPSVIVPKSVGGKTPLVILDEIHKERRWKRSLKGVFDTLKHPCDFLVNGSARLGIYMKGSDSLVGRHYSFRMHPFSLREMETSDVPTPERMLDDLFGKASKSSISVNRLLDDLMKYGPFPQPLLAQDERRARLWRRNREQLVIREDLRDLSRLPELGRIEMMTTLIPERVGSLFSMASLARDLETSIPTVKRWLMYLKDLYYLFEIKPFSRKVVRSLRREGKVYLWDFASIPDKAAKFENMVALHLYKICNYWTDTGEGLFDLYFLRDKEKAEVDFLVTRDGEPWLPVEVKYADMAPSKNLAKFVPMLGCKQALQLVYQPAWRIHEYAGAKILVAGAGDALSRVV